MAKIAVYLLSALLLVSSAVAAQWDSIHPFKLDKQNVQTCYWVAQDPATRCLLTSKKTVPVKQKIDVHVYTHCRSTCENHLPAGVTQDKAATDSEMKFPLLGLKPPNAVTGKIDTEYFFKTCSYIVTNGVSSGYPLFLFLHFV